MSLDLINFLRARLAEDREVALKAGADAWSLDHFTRAGGVVFASGERPIAEFDADPQHQHAQDRASADFHQAAHIARHDPARVLVEVDTKSRLLTMYEEAGRTRLQPPTAERWMAAGVERAVLEDTFRAFAAVYADHPDYRDEWRP
jgi:hypothetical protein